jgi:hypothetical protein
LQVSRAQGSAAPSMLTLQTSDKDTQQWQQANQVSFLNEPTIWIVYACFNEKTGNTQMHPHKFSAQIKYSLGN